MKRWTNMSKEERQSIEDMLMDGMSCREIMRKTGRSVQLIQSIKRDLGLLTDKKQAQTEYQLSNWFIQHGNWNWKIENPPKRRPSGKYRAVRKGQMGHLRTPYRPDGRFQ